MTNQTIRNELKEKKVYQWELAHELGVSEQTILRRLRFEMGLNEQMRLIQLIREIQLRKENCL